jgi:hypothetical protein
MIICWFCPCLASSFESTVCVGVFYNDGDGDGDGDGDADADDRRE